MVYIIKYEDGSYKNKIFYDKEVAKKYLAENDRTGYGAIYKIDSMIWGFDLIKYMDENGYLEKVL